jgi:hypothetical protein
MSRLVNWDRSSSSSLALLGFLGLEEVFLGVVFSSSSSDTPKESGDDEES